MPGRGTVGKLRSGQREEEYEEIEKTNKGVGEGWAFVPVGKEERRWW